MFSGLGQTHRTAVIALSCALFGIAYASACAGVPPCERNSDCLEGYCKAGECAIDCRREIDCDPAEFCNALAQCEPVDGSSSQSSASAQGGSGQGGASSVGGSTSDASGGAGGGSGGATGDGGELDLCTSDAQCGGALSCKAMTKGGGKRCTRSCGSNNDCPQGFRCLNDSTGNFCLADDTGATCAVASACNFACILGPNFCTVPCSNGAGCAAGYGCMEVGGQDVCVQTQRYCTDGSVCAFACDLSPSLVIGGCTTECNAASDCPQRAAPLSPWSCSNGSCVRPADVYGSLPGGYEPAEYHCDINAQPVALCNDALHIDFDQYLIPDPPSVNCGANETVAGVAGDACLDSCLLAGGCASDFSCVGIGNLGAQRVGLCLPTGSGEPGDSCSVHRDCAFGYCANGTCSKDCTDDGVCPNGTDCVAGDAPAIEGKTWRRCQ